MGSVKPICDCIDGPTGIQGLKGPDGSQGLTGTVTGSNGNVGATGVAGLTGEQGITGVEGNVGTTGANSATAGVQGEQGPNGNVGNQGAQGANGADGTNGSDGTKAIGWTTFQKLTNPCNGAICYSDAGINVTKFLAWQGPGTTYHRLPGTWNATVPTVGDCVSYYGMVGCAGWKIQCQAAQQIEMTGGHLTTLGVGGEVLIANTNFGDCLVLMYLGSDKWIVMKAEFANNQLPSFI